MKQQTLTENVICDLFGDRLITTAYNFNRKLMDSFCPEKLTSSKIPNLNT